MSRDLVTLTTDFGERDAYVGAMKGAILSVNPAARLVDVTHGIPPQNVAAAARVLAESTVYFPPGSVHLCVVDPGVGGDRAILYAEIAGRRYVAPDNGVLSRLLDEHPASVLLRVDEAAFARHGLSATFHGRDVMGPLVGALSRTPGPALAAIGTPVEQVVRLAPSTPKLVDATLVGVIESIDAFGNLITNIRRADFDQWKTSTGQSEGRPRCVLSDGSKISDSLSRTYAELTVGELGWLFGSSGWLEIAVRDGSAAARTGASVGDEVILEIGP